MEDPQGQSAHDNKQGADPQGQPSGQLITLKNGQQVEPEKLAKMVEDAQSEIGRLKNEIGGLRKEGKPAQGAENQLAEAEAIAQVLMPYLKKAGLATTDDVQSLQQERKLEKFFGANPKLEGKRELLGTLSKQHPEMSYEDIVAKYGLGEAPASQASGDVMGNVNRQRFAKENQGGKKMEIENVETADDLKKFEEEHGIGKTNKFSKRGTV